MESISPSFFGQYFGRFLNSSSLININKDNVIIHLKSETLTIAWQDLVVPPIFQLSFFGQIVTFKTATKRYVFTMLAYNAKFMQKKNCDTFWINSNINRVDTLLSSIQKITCINYLRQSTINRIRALVSTEYQRWFPWIGSSKAKDLVYTKMTKLSYYKNWQEKDINIIREQFINEQLKQHQLFFDNVESNPLTPSQRRACVIDNDNNLLLAGAGTGKTSVMIGRTGYLINSQQANPDQILLLAYGRKAADEMDERIKEKLSTDKISATTFHSLGLNIIAQVEGAKPSLSVFADDEKAKFKWIQTYFEQLLDQDESYRAKIIEYFNKYSFIEKSLFDFSSLGEYYQYLEDNEIRTYKGEKVKSFGELHIANELFSKGIKYQYEEKYIHDVKTIERRQYQPDFFLPELDIYIEYYGIDENKNTAPYINNQEYLNSIKWKQEIHDKYNTKCIELTYGQHKQGKLISSLLQILSSKIEAKGLTFDELSTKQKLASLRESGRITNLASIFGALIGLYKAACLTPSLEKQLISNSPQPAQTEKALELLNPVLVAYEKHLKSHNEIDFDDMINKALNYVTTGKFKSPWRYIMVDEFQDISEPRARLVKALRDNYENCSVFAVGDDWQAIYRFTGADFTLTTQFSDYFGATTQSELDQTFRFNNQIGNVATKFISKNPAQINKTIKSFKQVSKPAVSLLRRDAVSSSNGSTTQDENRAIEDVLNTISARVTTKTSVYILARIWALMPDKTALHSLAKQYPLLTIECQTFHASKGKEADYVIILGLQTGKSGFPSERVTPPLIDALLPKKEAFAYAEERRLFYVALTRAKDRVYLIADMTNASPFVKELIDEHHIELNEFETPIHQTFANDIKCLKCETGNLKKRSGQFSTFYSCSHYPLCDHLEKPCTKCESPMTRKQHQGFKFCLNDLCKTLIPTCEKCNAEMVLRSGKNGDFWGCKNYKGNDSLSCKNTINNTSIKWPELID